MEVGGLGVGMADVEGGGEMRREREILFYLILEGLQTPVVLCN